MFISALGAILGGGVVYLLWGSDPNPPPIGVYMIAAAACGPGAAWLYVRLRYGKDANITIDRRLD